MIYFEESFYLDFIAFKQILNSLFVWNTFFIKICHRYLIKSNENRLNILIKAKEAFKLKKKSLGQGTKIYQTKNCRIWWFRLENIRA